LKIQNKIKYFISSNFGDISIKPFQKESKTIGIDFHRPRTVVSLLEFSRELKKVILHDKNFKDKMD